VLSRSGGDVGRRERLGAMMIGLKQRDSDAKQETPHGIISARFG